METIKIPYKVKFSGLDADRNELEAYSAAKSLEGLTWALSVTLNFATTGDYKARGDVSKSSKIFMRPARRGSFISEMNALVLANPFVSTIAMGVGVNLISPYINSTVGYVFGRSLGLISEMPSGFLKYYKRMSKSEKDKLDLLLRRVEPPLTRAHAVIDKTAEDIHFVSKRTELFKMNSLSKEYIEAKPSNSPEIIYTNITAYNVVSRNGRIFDPVNGKTEAFTLIKKPLKGTAGTVTTSMDQYQAGRKGMVKVTVDRVQTKSGRLKKFLVTSAEEIPRSDWEKNEDPLRSSR